MATTPLHHQDTTEPSHEKTDPGFPSAFRYADALQNRRLAAVRRLAVKFTGKDLFPPEEHIQTFAEDMFRSDPVAERFVDEVYGEHGPQAARAMLDKALTEGLDAVENPPPAMVALFEEFETVPEWVDPELIAEVDVHRRPVDVAGILRQRLEQGDTVASAGQDHRGKPAGGLCRRHGCDEPLGDRCDKAVLVIEADHVWMDTHRLALPPDLRMRCHE